MRYVVERTLSWATGWRRIELGVERTGAHWQAMNELACRFICANRIRAMNRRERGQRTERIVA